MVAVMTTKIIVGLMLGKVIAKNLRSDPAPSIAADSCSSRGTACMAAKRISALYPVQRQFTMVAMARWEGITSLFQATGSILMVWSRLLISPYFSSKAEEKI